MSEDQGTGQPEQPGAGVPPEAFWSRTPLLHIALLAGVCGGLFLYQAGALPLGDPDESRCAVIVRHMLQTGDWLVPQLNGEKYFDKPAPFFWLAAAGERLTGGDELGGRLVAALAGFLAVLATYALGRRLFGPTAGVLAGLMLATCGEFLYVARWYRMDMPFTAAMWAALWWFWRGELQRRAGVKRAQLIQWAGFFLCCGLAVNFKGPAGLGLPVLIVGAYFLLSRNWRRVLEFFNPLGLALFTLAAAPWYVLVSLREPTFLAELFRQNVGRYTSETFGHSLPPGIYIPILLGGLLPWTIYLPGLFARHFPRRWRLRAQDPARLFLWLAALTPVVFFSFSGTKLITYILPAFPPLAVMLGAMLAEWFDAHRPDRMMRLGAIGLAVTLAVMLGAVAGMEIWLKCASGWLALPAAVTALVIWRMLRSVAKDRRRACFAWAMLGIVVNYLFLIGHTAPVGYELLSLRTLARSADPAALAQAEVCLYRNTRFSFMYYGNVSRATTSHTPSADSPRELQALLSSDRPVFAVITGAQHLADIQKACAGRAFVVGQQAEAWLVSNRPPGQDHPPAP